MTAIVTRLRLCSGMSPVETNGGTSSGTCPCFFRLWYPLITEGQEALAECLCAVPERAAKLRACVGAGRRDRRWLRDSLQQLQRLGSIDRRDVSGLRNRSSWSRDSAPHLCRSHVRCESYGLRRRCTVSEGTERSCAAHDVRRRQ